jgi:hypothetical protein
MLDILRFLRPFSDGGTLTSSHSMGQRWLSRAECAVDLQEAHPQRQGKRGPAVQSIYTYFSLDVSSRRIYPLSHFLYLLSLSRPPYTL